MSSSIFVIYVFSFFQCQWRCTVCSRNTSPSPPMPNRAFSKYGNFSFAFLSLFVSFFWHFFPTVFFFFVFSLQCETLPGRLRTRWFVLYSSFAGLIFSLLLFGLSFLSALFFLSCSSLKSCKLWHRSRKRSCACATASTFSSRVKCSLRTLLTFTKILNKRTSWRYEEERVKARKCNERGREKRKRKSKFLPCRFFFILFFLACNKFS